MVDVNHSPHDWERVGVGRKRGRGRGRKKRKGRGEREVGDLTVLKGIFSMTRRPVTRPLPLKHPPPPNSQELSFRDCDPDPTYSRWSQPCYLTT